MEGVPGVGLGVGPCTTRTIPPASSSTGIDQADPGWVSWFGRVGWALALAVAAAAVLARKAHLHDNAPQQAAHDVAAPRVGGRHAVAQQIGHGTRMVANHLFGSVCVWPCMAFMRYKRCARRLRGSVFQRQRAIGRQRHAGMSDTGAYGTKSAQPCCCIERSVCAKHEVPACRRGWCRPRRSRNHQHINQEDKLHPPALLPAAPTLSAVLTVGDAVE